MPRSTTSNQQPTPPTHDDFHWIHGPGREEIFANFIELTATSVPVLPPACKLFTPVI